MVNSLNGDLAFRLVVLAVCLSWALTMPLQRAMRALKTTLGFTTTHFADIAPSSVIFMLSTGAVRELHFRFNDAENPSVIIPTTPGDLIVLCPRNEPPDAHSIVQVADEVFIKRGQGLVLRKRMSLVFRNIRTKMSRTHVFRKAAATVDGRKGRADRKRARDHASKETMRRVLKRGVHPPSESE